MTIWIGNVIKTAPKSHDLGQIFKSFVESHHRSLKISRQSSETVPKLYLKCTITERGINKSSHYALWSYNHIAKQYFSLKKDNINVLIQVINIL